MTERLTVGFLLVLGTLGMWPGAVGAARPEAVELKGSGRSLGQLSRIVGDDGGAYVSAERLASLLRGSWSVKGNRGTLTVGKRAAQFVQNQPRVVILSQTLALQSPTRIGVGGWLIPEEFLTKGLARLAPGVTVVPATSDGRRPRATVVKESVEFGELRHRSYPSFTRVVLETEGTLAYTVAAGREEIRVRLPRPSLDGARVEEVGDGLVKEIRLAPAGTDAELRVVLEGAAGAVKDSMLRDPFRLVLDVYRARDAAGGETGRPGMQPLRLIVLDPGHGGHDPGAIGPSGLTEKDVVLDVTRRVARLAEDGLGVKIALTRATDVFIPLRERTNVANKQRADLFVSIHANAHPRAVSEGVETYFLSSEASDSDARQVAAIENGVIQLESPASRAKGELLKSILWDLAQSEFQQESSFLAETVQDSMTQSLSLVNRGVKQAGFYVLGGAATPAILIEIGFMTNRKEERKLATPEYRAAVARAIYAGLAEYKRRYDQRLRTVQSLPVGAQEPR